MLGILTLVVLGVGLIFYEEYESIKKAPATATPLAPQQLGDSIADTARSSASQPLEPPGMAQHLSPFHRSSPRPQATQPLLPLLIRR